MYNILYFEAQLPALIKIFSVRATSRSLFRLTNPRSNPNVIDCLHGMRCMSLFWVVFGHEYMFSMVSPNINQLGLINVSYTLLYLSTIILGVSYSFIPAVASITLPKHDHPWRVFRGHVLLPQWFAGDYDCSAFNGEVRFTRTMPDSVKQSINSI